MRFVPLLAILLFSDAFALTVTDIPGVVLESCPAGGTLWIQVASECRDMQQKVFPARIVERLSGELLQIESRQSVLINGNRRIAVLTAHVRRQDILPGNRISSLMMFHTTVVYTDAPFTTNQPWFSRLLSWIF